MDEYPAPADSPRTPAGEFPADVDAALESVLREQRLLPLPLALMSRILGEILPLERVRPLTLLSRVAAAAAVFLAAWFAFAGNAPALADVAPSAKVAAALPSSLGPDGRAGDALAAADALTTTSVSAGAWVLLGSGLLLLLAGLALTIWFHQPAPGAARGERT